MVNDLHEYKNNILTIIIFNGYVFIRIFFSEGIKKDCKPVSDSFLFDDVLT